MRVTSFRGHDVYYLEQGLDPYEMFEGWEHEKKAREFCLRNNDIVIDVGACIGSWAIPAAIIGKKVYAFEPNGGNAAMMKMNVDVNKLKNVEILQDVVWNKDEPVTFEGWTVDKHFNRLKPASNGIRLDTFCQDFKPDFIKVDVEGSELYVIEGAERLIREGAPRMLIEAHISYNKNASNEVIRKILSLNNNYKVNLLSTNKNQYAHIYFEKKG